jgi:hypothetical protein
METIMKKSMPKLLKNMLLFTLFALIIACKSAPPETAPEPVPTPSEPARAEPAPSPPPPPSTDGAAERNRALEAMNKAKSIKADIAVKDEFNAAQNLFDEGEALLASSSGGAAQKYLEAETRFLAAYDSAYAKREEALRQLNLARQAIKSVEDDAAAYDEEADQ